MAKTESAIARAAFQSFPQDNVAIFVLRVGPVNPRVYGAEKRYGLFLQGNGHMQESAVVANEQIRFIDQRRGLA